MDSFEDCEDVEMLSDCKVFEEHVVLRADTHHLSELLLVLHDVVVLIDSCSARRLNQSRHHRNRGGLPSSIMSQQSKNLSFVNGQIQAIHCCLLPELLPQIPNEHRLPFSLLLLQGSVNFFHCALSHILALQVHRTRSHYLLPKRFQSEIFSENESRLPGSAFSDRQHLVQIHPQQCVDHEV